MPRDDLVGGRENAAAARLERSLVVGQRVDLRCSVTAPPCMGAGHNPVIRLHQERRVLLCVAGGQDQGGMFTHAVPVAGMIQPLVAAVASPEVHQLRVREERDVDRVIGVVMGDDDVRHLLRRHAQRPQWGQDEVAHSDHSWIDHDHRRTVEHRTDRPGNSVVADVADVQEMESSRHARSLARAGQALAPGLR